MSQKIENVVILGGGTAGWITASLLVKVFGQSLDITLIESDEIGSIGVGEATIPPITHFNAALGINEGEFLKATKGTIKLGIQFENWGNIGQSYMHAFGGIGKDFPFSSFHHVWLKTQKEGIDTDFWDFSLNYQAAKKNRFSPLSKIEGTNLPGLVHAYHFDAGLYANLLKEKCLLAGVKRVEGMVEEVSLNKDSGFVEKLILSNGSEINGQLFVDCSGQYGVLIEKALNTGYEDWSHWLPCDRALAVASESVSPIVPYTRSIAHRAGWQWQIPLQHRTGNGLVYSSKHMSDKQAKELLLNNLNGKALSEPRLIPFRVGRRLKQWNKNVVAIGLSSGFLEPLESTSIHLIQTAVTRLIKHFPHQGIKQSEVNEFNRQAKSEIERIRDFIILHYKVNNRNDSDFWRNCQSMDIPVSLANKIELFKTSGKVFRDYEDLFTEVAWQQVFIGQGVLAEDHHPIASTLTHEQSKELLENLKVLIDASVDKLASHQAFLDDL